MHDGKPCGRPATYGDKCVCHTDRENKDTRVFQRELDKIFGDEKAECYDLSHFIFPKRGYKLPEEYKKDVYFRLAKFSRRVDFSGATFSEAAIFNGADFSGGAKFRWVTFSGEAEFLGVTFSGKADFGGARFFKYVNFFHCRVQNDSSMIFDGGVLPTKEKGQVFTGGAGFIACFFAEPKKISFRKLSLEKCKLLETDVTGLQFVNVKWARKPKFFKWFHREAVYDELSEKPEYNLIAQLYRRLQANYVNNYRYSEAGDFYIGEQEMMRKAKGSGWMIWRRVFCTNFLYKYISYYGQSFLLPLFWMLAVLFLFPLYLIYDGIIKDGYGNAFWKNLSFVTLNRADIGKYVTEPYQQGIVTLEGLLLVVLVTFFILALRRKYKRKTF